MLLQQLLQRTPEYEAAHVTMPHSYTGAPLRQRRSKSYPVLYLLHG
jgi:hypothetical protein